MRNARSKKLVLSRESLARLTAGTLDIVAGGDIPPFTATCQSCRGVCPLQTFNFNCETRRPQCLTA